MAIRSGFFNSVNGDRKYDASRFAEYFASFIGNGVFPNPSDGLQVIANNDMTVTVKAGKCWINGYIMINDDDYILEIEPADGVLNRIDRVVARYDVVDREIRLEVKKGTFASSPVAPALQRDADAYELALADVYVAAGSISISQADITDLRLNSELCGIVHGTVEQVDTTTLFNQYLTWLQEKKTQYDNDMINWTSQKQAEFEDWVTAQEQDFENWRMQEEQNFNDWFNSIQDILDENVATTILNMIGDLSNLTTADKSSLVNAINEVNAKEVDLTPIEDQIADLEDDFESHKNEIATQDTLGHISLQDIPVKSVNGKTGEVVIDAEDIAGLNDSKIKIGKDASVDGDYGIAIGSIAKTQGYNGPIAIGRDAQANNNSAIAIGMQAEVNNMSGGIAIGRLAKVDGGFMALGGEATGGEGSISIGKYSVSSNANEGVLGSTHEWGASHWKVPGSFTVSGTKNFEIPHPKPEKKATHVIRHGAVESPTPGDTLYRWKVQATKDNDIVTIDLPDYFIWLNKNVQIFVTPQGHFGNGYGVLNRETEQLEIHCQYEGEYNVLVIGTRNDDHPSIQEWYIKGVEREIGESWTGETYAFEIDEIIEMEEIKEVSA